MTQLFRRLVYQLCLLRFLHLRLANQRTVMALALYEKRQSAVHSVCINQGTARFVLFFRSEMQYYIYNGSVNDGSCQECHTQTVKLKCTK